MTDYDSDDIKKQISTLIKNHLNTDNENKEIEQRIKVEEDEDEERNSRENELKDMCENEILNLQNLQCLNSSEDEINPLNHNNNNTTTTNNNNNSGSNQFIKKNYNNGETPLLQHYKRIKNKTGNSKNDIIKTKTPPLLLSLSSTRLTSVKDNNSPTLMTQIKRQFLQFCETTSLRGVPRIERVMASQLTGARLLLHPGASYPRVAEEGVNLMPGTMTDIRFTVYEWSMMEPPHGRCSKNTPKFISFNNVSYTFSEEACHAYMVQEKVASNCQCLTQHLPIPTHLLGKDLRKCQAFKLPATYQMLDNFTKSKQLYFNQEVVAHFAHFAECAEKTGTAMDSYQVGCRPACVRYTYKPSITAAQWPTKTFLTWFVTKFIKEMESYGRSHLNSTNNESLKVFNERMEELRKPLQPYEKIANLTKEGDLQEAIKMLMQTQIFEQNFLSIIISRPNFDLERVEEKAVVSLTSLFSQIGGLLSIWIGLTFVCIVEIVELGLNVADAVIHYKKSKS
ncbi:unnamed protein product [Heterobilharzia americana]|nr:unnamed protein product [Heterobilharzia americana]